MMSILDYTQQAKIAKDMAYQYIFLDEKIE